MKHSRKQPIYCSVPLEFVQPWDYAKRIRQLKELKLGNTTWLSIAFHVGNSAAERERWKNAFPEMAALIDATPKFQARPKHGMARIFPMSLVLAGVPRTGGNAGLRVPIRIFPLSEVTVGGV